MEGETRPEAVVLGSFTGKFVFEDLKFRKLRNGHKIRVVIETDYSAGVFGELGDLLEKHVVVGFTEFIPEKKTGALTPQEKDEKDQLKLEIETPPGQEAVEEPVTEIPSADGPVPTEEPVPQEA